MLTSVSNALVEALRYELDDNVWLMEQEIDNAVYFAITQYHVDPDSLIDLYIPQYESQIRESFDFEQMGNDSLWGAETNENGDLECRAFLGTVFDMYPSGKYHTVWAQTNITLLEYIKDGAYSEALDTAAALYGGWIESGEGDPCDLFFCRIVDSD